MNPLDLTGMKFGRLTAIHIGPRGPRNILRWKCACSCGSRSLVTVANLRNNHTRSCGCLLIELRPSFRRTHGQSRSPEHKSWAKIKERCYNPKDIGFKDYGKRGIKMCARWRKSFAAFLKDVGLRPSPSHSIDRVDNDGNYTPNNCRWATYFQQANNRRGNHILHHAGKSQTIAQWERDLGFKTGTIGCRLFQGWSEERALTQKPRRSPIKNEN